MYAQVIVDIAVDSLAHTFSYLIPPDMQLQEGCRVSVPFGRMTKEGIVVGFSDTVDVPLEKLKPILKKLEEYPAVLPHMMYLAQQMAQESHCPLAETLRLMFPSEMRGEHVHVKEQTMIQLVIPEEEIDEAIARQGRSQKRRMIIRLLSDGEPHPLNELKLFVNEPNDAVKQLQAEHIVEVTKEEVLRMPGGEMPPMAPDPVLTAVQEEVLEELTPAVASGKGQFLLHGVTGSGKTEVFVRLVRQVLAKGQSAIILVPEIALTPQMVTYFRSRFGEVAAVLHSGLSAGEKYDEWRRIRFGRARVVVGARSAIFAPCENLGLIVVDEEHETTYISDRHPRYDARDVAALRCERERAVLLLASATPSVLSFAKARRGDYTLLEMPVRIGNRPLPEVQLVDMRAELTAGNRSIFSGALTAALKNCISRGEQAMLLMNRRGYNTFISCRSCGTAMKCPNCDIAMTYHMNTGELHCHYCGYTIEPPDICPKCHSRAIRYFGAGTQKVEEELKKLFPRVGVVRMDVDTTGGKDGHAKLLEIFRSGKASILVGTQMIAKGHDFPKVTVVGVLAADATLNLPDYRSRERTFQLLTQVAGRAGRGELPGKVIIQTYKPEDPTITLAATQDYRSFFEAEFARRRAGLYPPFTAMGRLLVESQCAEDAEKQARLLYEQAAKELEAHPEWKKRTLVCRLDQPGVAFLRGKYRWQVFYRILVHPETEAFCRFLSDLSREKPEGVEVYFEYNPTTMM